MCPSDSTHSNKKAHRLEQDKQGFVISFMETVTRFLRRAASGHWAEQGPIFPPLQGQMDRGTKSACLAGQEMMRRSGCKEANDIAMSLFLIDKVLKKVPFVVLAFQRFNRNLK